jgi:outer membrane protein OmpA-like peptidoglycan-associated protein
MAGCIEPSSIWTDKFTSSQSSEIVSKTNRIPQKKQEPPAQIPPEIMNVYFPNDNVIIDKAYENGLSGATTADTINYGSNPDGKGFGLGAYPSKYTPGLTNDGKGDDTWDDRYDYGLNYNGPDAPVSKIGDASFKGFYSPGYFDALAEYLKTKCTFCKATVSGYASAQGTSQYNELLSKDRAKTVVDYYVTELSTRMGKSKAELEKIIIVGKNKELPAGNPTTTTYINPDNNNKKETYKITTSASGCIVCKKQDVASKKVRNVICPPDNKGCKLDRKVEITWEYDAAAALAAVAQPEDKIEITNENVTTTIKQKFYNETMFFDKLLKTDSFIFDKFREKIKYFHPAFHSTTPEGLNSRLTFLQQCTRQGSTDNKNTNNLAFGRPPVCILRIGDFYHTKIVMDSVSFEYEPLVWDLNPEGIGVQPMIANVSISFKFFGGESMYGPLNKLQNALSFNYFANTQVYEARADYISQEKQSNTTVSVTDTPGKKAEDGSSERYDVTVTAQRLSPTGFYYNNGRQSIDPEISTVSTTVAPVANPDNQTKGNEAANSGTANQTEPATTATTEPKIVGFSYVNINGIVGSSTQKTVSVAVKNENIEVYDKAGGFYNRLISDDELKKFLEKGVKFVLEGTPTPSQSSRHEELITWGGNGFKDPWNLFSGGYALGTIPWTGSFVVELPISGDYMLSLYYNNEKIQTIPVQVGVIRDTGIGTSEQYQKFFD